VNLGRALMATLLVASIGAGCGSGDDDSDAAVDSSEAAATSDPLSSQPVPFTVPENADAADTGAGDVAYSGDNGGVEFTISGGHEKSGDYVWIPVASSYAPGWWAMSFTEPSGVGAAVLSLALDPANTNVSFGDGEITIFGMAPQCSFNIDHQDSSGASGSFDCADLTAITAAEMVPGISFSGTFDARM
jgi:hypothetical protein